MLTIRMTLSLLMIGILPAHAADDGKAQRWVQGSWVNVRSGQDAASAVVDHLSTNTPLTLLGEQGGSCEIGWGKDRRGFVACKLLGTAALTLEQVSRETLPDGKPNPTYSPPRAFWIAPTAERLFAAGQYFWSTLLTEKQRKAERFDPNANEAMADSEPKHSPALVRYKIPEYEAMKALLAKGVIAAGDSYLPLADWRKLQGMAQAAIKDKRDFAGEFSHPHPLANGINMGLGHEYLIANVTLPAVTGSLFRSESDIAAASSSYEALSAHFGITERLKLTAGPYWVKGDRNDDYLQWYAGAWDIGKATLALDSPPIETVIGRTGLLGSYQLAAEKQLTPNAAEPGCPGGFQQARRASTLLPGYPAVKDALLGIITPRALGFQRATLHHATLDLSKAEYRQARPNGTVNPLGRASVYQIDLNGDGIADLAFIEGVGVSPMYGGKPVSLARITVVNIAGEWRLLDSDSFVECT